MDSLIFALNAVLPIVLIVALGYLLKRIRFFGDGFPKTLNKLVFRVLLPAMLFLNVYKIESFEGIGLGYIGFVAVGTLALFALSLPVVMLVTKKRAERGVLWQGVFRSNYALVGIPLATSLYGEMGSIVASVLSAVYVPRLNMLAVICLTVFGSGEERVSAKKILVGIVKNPLIQAIALGGAVLGVRALFVRWGIHFRLADVKPIYSMLEQIGRTATPMALLALGAQFEFSAVSSLKKQIIFATVARTVAVPAVALSIAYALGCFNGAHFAAFVAVFGTPISISSVPMAQEMGADAKLAGQLVVWTTVVSGFTIFLISFILKAVGVFV